ncbi:putative Dihydroxyacetone kinase, L subunit [Vibrio nigripulchritudo SFn27]|uniref:Putative Dihydroxyacetone kinase, L subunit n=1 Tax=Vibrio nigripulchritudo TaxID=28173 RepID=U4K1X7_9VIBR|nr:dihydroxyacetone kinase subunit DhaL [Vibrio nigripulchritudo]CCN83193.1 putative Dihydroxyacetone kinase, L subunit [Vibrio nigripulchritudo BLFn1]CCN88624.1 putative Dihydroxyacetone kinase, L subunit [Vibrio nigripulchritudo SFn27]CCN92763.1 putative Dihydroxyacetone kinase, L subunit [Vibrio nigripulchritudo ENn2]CCO40349.1 putative Dihydroxyacetone kinase, L subunit [Vibrio nigripulchritudo SFn135]CCO52667.1 putative Dihydroxyacetone kinase, L subunit [Vibrio nigripulchritudo Wn13]
MAYLNALDGKAIMIEICDVIVENKAYLSEIDGLIGDGDHGINMAKGFALCKSDLEKLNDVNLGQAFQVLANILMGSIGGSMGPIYGSVFVAMGLEADGKERITQQDFAEILSEGLIGLQDISDAKVGDKCIMDTLVPAVEAMQKSVREEFSFEGSLSNMEAAAKAGAESTKDLVSKIGRSSRLGERSVGVLDAGAVSCSLILSQLAQSTISRLQS